MVRFLSDRCRVNAAGSSGVLSGSLGARLSFDAALVILRVVGVVGVAVASSTSKDRLLVILVGVCGVFSPSSAR